MSTVTSKAINPRPKSSAVMVPDVSSAVKAMMEGALEFCAKKAGLEGREQAVECLLNGDCAVHGYLRYCLAKRLGKYLGSVDDTIKAIYFYGHEYGTSPEDLVEETTDLTSGINLIVWVDRKTAALSSVAASLDQALIEEYKHLVAPKADKLRYMLDVQFVEDEEVENRTGYGVLINSVYSPPIRIWGR